MKNPCIVTYFMGNILDKTPEMQRKVIEKYNKSKVPLYQVKGAPSHGQFIDYFWSVNGAGPDYTKEANIKQELEHDVILILDIDCIPLNENSIDYYLEQAAAGKLIGNIQRSNHIENDQHVFAAPSAVAISKETYVKIGRPPAQETPRSDVAEEYTWAAEANNVPVELVMPLSYAKAPHKYGWEKDQNPWWALKDGMPVYGIGTTFGNEQFGEMYYHNFQIGHPGNQEMFWERCEKALNA
jgi:hypothetical protein